VKQASAYIGHIPFFFITISVGWPKYNYLLPYQGCLNVQEKNMEKNFQTKKNNYCYYNKNYFYVLYDYL
jgi:hypothetical protein